MPAAWSIDSSTSYSRKPPHRGMTMAQVSAYYGQPYRRIGSGEEEQWVYRLKFAEVYGKAWVPFEFDSDNVTLGTITFGPDGKVRRYDWRRTNVQ